ncbi:MAG: NAD(P)H-hydrate epimerase, partial [Thermoplasmatota archaeon]
MLPYKEVGIADRNSEYRGVPPIELMENAGRGLAEVIDERYPEKKVLFICGTGNNGGDAYVAARYLSEKIGKEDVTVFLIKGEDNIRSEISRKNFERLECEIVEELDWNKYEDHLLVDALLGTGISGEIREPYRSVMKEMNE